MLKKLVILSVVILFSAANLYAENINLVGIWNGELSVSGLKFRLAFNLSDSNGGLTATMDSPDQGAYDIPIDSAIVRHDSLFLYQAALKAMYVGTINSDYQSITGQWHQGGMSFPLDLTKGDKLMLNRPQEPLPPYPYLEEEISYTNPDDGAVLAGTLTLPQGEGPFPAALLITGSGAQDRDELIFGHKPFKVIADYLTRKGIAVLRVDDRGYGKSTGDMENATTMTFVGDAQAGVEFLKNRPEIDKSKIGLIGHSEGAIIAPILATTTDDIDYIVMLAGTGLNGQQILLKQADDLMRAEGLSDQIIQSSNFLRENMYRIVLEESDYPTINKKVKQFVTDNRDILDPEFLEIVDTSSEQSWALAIQQAMSPWMKFFLKYDPYPALAKVKCPALYLVGEKDLQVNAEDNAPIIDKALSEAGNQHYQVIRLENLNHLFQTCETGKVEEYGQIEETISPAVLKIIGDWISEQIK